MQIWTYEKRLLLLKNMKKFITLNVFIHIFIIRCIMASVLCSRFITKFEQFATDASSLVRVYFECIMKFFKLLTNNMDKYIRVYYMFFYKHNVYKHTEAQFSKKLRLHISTPHFCILIRKNLSF